jgi:hypothetical protein
MWCDMNTSWSAAAASRVIFYDTHSPFFTAIITTFTPFLLTPQRKVYMVTWDRHLFTKWGTCATQCQHRRLIQLVDLDR